MRKIRWIGFYGMEVPVSTRTTLAHRKRCSESGFSLDFCLKQVSIMDAKAREHEEGKKIKVYCLKSPTGFLEKYVTSQRV